MKLLIAVTIKALLDKARLELKTSRQNAELEAEVLLAFILNVRKEFLLIHSDKQISKTKAKRYFECVYELKSQKPLSYITHNREFYGTNYFVNQYVLIPRPESELLVDLALNAIKIKANNSLNILEIGTGSGCIPISIINNTDQNIKIDAIDISKKALSVAKVNAHNILTSSKKTQLKFANKNIFTWQPLKQYDMIISNPPYIAPSEYTSLDRTVKEYEPKLALVAQDNGLEFYKRIKQLLEEVLTPNGVCLIEINSNLEYQISSLFFSEYKVLSYKDHAGLPRVLSISKELR